LSAARLNLIENADTAHVLMSQRIVKGFEDSGLGVWSDRGVEGYRDLGKENPVFRRGTSHMYVPDNAYPVVRPFVEAGRPPFGRDLNLLQFAVKRLELSLSMFHDFHVAGMFALTHPLDPVTYQGIPEMTRAAAQGVMQFVTTGSLKGAPGVYELWGPVKRGMEYATNPTEVMEQLHRGGLVTSKSKLPDTYGEMLHPEKQNVFQKVQSLRDRALWDRLWTGLKAYDAVQTAQEALRKLDSGTNPKTGARYTHQEIIDEVADLMNRKYGGLNWDRMGTAQQTRQNMRALLFAPDWLFANLGYVAKGMEGLADLRAGRDTVAAKIALKDLVVLGATWMSLTQAASLVMNGHTTFQNEPGHEFQLEVPTHGPKGQRQYVDVTTPAAFLTLTHLIQGATQGWRSGTGGLPGPFGAQPNSILTKGDSALMGLANRFQSLASARLAFLPRVGLQAFGAAPAFGGAPIRTGTSFLEQAGQSAENLPFQALPFTVQSALRATPGVGPHMPGGQISPVQAASQLAGVGTPSLGRVEPLSTFSSGLSKIEKAQFLDALSEAEKIEFARQRGQGQFSGDLADKLRAAVNRRNALNQAATGRETQMLERGDIRGAVQSMAARGETTAAIRKKILPYVIRQFHSSDGRLQESSP
jgi:hypothetical protein